MNASMNSHNHTCNYVKFAHRWISSKQNYFFYYFMPVKPLCLIQQKYKLYIEASLMIIQFLVNVDKKLVFIHNLKHLNCTLGASKAINLWINLIFFKNISTKIHWFWILLVSYQTITIKKTVKIGPTEMYYFI